MRSYRSLIAVVGVVVVLLAGAGAVYAYDHGHRNVIADGITVAGIDVGGLKAAEARSRLHRRYERRLRRPVVASFHGQRFTLSPAAAHVKVDIDAAVDQALAAQPGRVDLHAHVALGHRRSRRRRHQAAGAPIPGRRSATGRPRTTHLDQAPRDASLSFASDSITKVPERTGREVDTAALTDSLRTALQRPGARHRLTVPVEPVEPKVTIDTLARKYPAAITVDRGAFTLRVYQHLKLTRSYSVAVGMQGLETPAGLYHVQNKVVDPVWSVPTSAWAGSLAGQVIPPGPSNPLKARWMGSVERRGDPRHRRDRLDRARVLARLCADAHPRRDRPLSTGQRRHAGVHRRLTRPDRDTRLSRPGTRA